MHLGVGRRQYTAFAAEALVPAFFVKMHILGVDLVVEARVPDMDLVRRDTDDGPLKQRSAIETHASAGRPHTILVV